MSAGIVFVGPLPPPLHGMAAVNAQMLTALRLRAETTAIAVGPSTDVRGARYHASKAISAFRAVSRLCVAKASGARVLYASVDDGLGGLWTLTFVIVGRLLNLRLYLHHHSYRYLIKRSRLMSVVVRAAGRHTCHVVLCDAMSAEFAAAYPRAACFFVAPNSVETTSEEPLPIGRRQTTLTLGLLANLTFDKGVADFVAIVEWALASGLDVRGHVAGPAADPEVARFLTAKCSELGDRLSWRGPVAGEDKEDFYANIDLFVFPTRYKTESFGLVLLEALVRGVPILAPRRGCISTFEGLEAAQVVPLNEEFESHARQLVSRYCADKASLTRLRHVAREAGVRLNRHHIECQARLVNEILSAARRQEP